MPEWLDTWRDELGDASGIDEYLDVLIPRIPFRDWIDEGFDWIKETFDSFFTAISEGVGTLVNGLDDGLTWLPGVVMVLVLAALAWLMRDWKLALGSLIGFVFISTMDQWENTMTTLATVAIAAAIALIIGIPLGILSAKSETASRIVRPIMDLMQTMPAFVWLVPVVALFGIGTAPAVIATVIFALPPGVRFTELGIRQVDVEVVEAGQAFGASPGQILRRIQLPLSLPTLMAGVNQVIMLALSMAVIGGMVGGGGLGGAVTSAIGQGEVGLGFEAGLSVVVLAIYLDRLTATIGKGRKGTGIFGRLRNRNGKQSKTTEPDPDPTPEVEEEVAASAATASRPGGMAF